MYVLHRVEPKDILEGCGTDDDCQGHGHQDTNSKGHNSSQVDQVQHDPEPNEPPEPDVRIHRAVC